MNWKRVLAVSRPRFWHYLAGPYIIGYAMTATSLHDFYSLPFLYTLFYFLIPANFFLYGINDYFDKDADRTNPKKTKQEDYLKNKDVFIVLQSVLASVLLAVPALFILPVDSKVIFIFFMLLSVAYSAQPIRLKTMPFFDSASNILYILPGFIGYTQHIFSPISVTCIVALACWPAAMHLFSAIVDIDSDEKANITTTATYLGKTTSLILCIILWAIFALYVFNIDQLYVLAFFYPIITVSMLNANDERLEKMYWKFPLINALLGMALFFYLVYTKFFL